MIVEISDTYINIAKISYFFEYQKTKSGKVAIFFDSGAKTEIPSQSKEKLEKAVSLYNDALFKKELRIFEGRKQRDDDD